MTENIFFLGILVFFTLLLFLEYSFDKLVMLLFLRAKKFRLKTFLYFLLICAIIYLEPELSGQIFKFFLKLLFNVLDGIFSVGKAVIANK